MALTDWTDPASLDAVVISHLHADHSVDVFGLLHYLAYRLGTVEGLPLLLPEGAIVKFAAFLGADSDADFFTTLAPREVDDADVVEVGDVTLRFARTTHSVPTNAVRIVHAGRSLAYSGDTGVGGGFPTLAIGCDVVLSEAGLGERRETASYPFHLTGAEAGAIAQEAGAGRLILTHLAPTLPVEEVTAAAQAAFVGPVLVATPGLRIEI
jgi:ribonuclease BN (tRNA processing enzyme)